MKEGMEITDLQVCLLLDMHMNPHERGYLHNYIHIEICKRPIFFSLNFSIVLKKGITSRTIPITPKYK